MTTITTTTTVTTTTIDGVDVSSITNLSELDISRLVGKRIVAIRKLNEQEKLKLLNPKDDGMFPVIELDDGTTIMDRNPELLNTIISLGGVVQQQ